MFRSAVTRVRAGYPFHRNAGGRREERTSGAKALSEGKGFIGAERAAPPKSEFSVNGKARVVLRACDGAAEAAAFRICAARIVLVRLRAMFQASLRDAVTFRAGHPALETPGYFRMSLRDKRITQYLRLFRPAGACSVFRSLTHGLRRGLQSFAASRLGDWGVDIRRGMRL